MQRVTIPREAFDAMLDALTGIQAHFESGKALATGKAVIEIDCIEVQATYIAAAAAIESLKNNTP